MFSPEGGFIVLEKALTTDLTTQVIVLTAFADLSQAVEAMRNGAFGYSVKTGEPGESAALVLQVKKAIQLRGARLFVFRSREPALGDIYARLQSIVDSANEALGQARTVLDLHDAMLRQSQRNTDPD
jgi:DNA-binding NtrC family response regulator